MTNEDRERCEQRERLAVYLEGVSEGFVEFLRNVRDWDLTIGSNEFKKVKVAHMKGFLGGIVWQLRKNQAAGKPSA